MILIIDYYHYHILLMKRNEPGEMSQNVLFPTGYVDIDMMILSLADRKIFSNMIINKYMKSIIEQNFFWKLRLENYLKLDSKSATDYKSITQFLDNDRSFSKDYIDACDKQHEHIQKILKDNNKHPYLSFGIKLVASHLVTKYIDHDCRVHIDVYKCSTKSYEKFVDVAVPLILEDSKTLDNFLLNEEIITGDTFTLKFQSGESYPIAIKKSNEKISLMTMLYRILRQLTVKK
jgi:hypothetical protein